MKGLKPYAFPVRLLLLLLTLLPFFSPAQNDVRSRIDIDRRYLRYDDDKSFEKSREFIRLDSTFYIGYMYEGAYLFYRANDEPGFSRAIRPLLKAMQLLEKDYDQQLRTRTNDIYTYLRVSPYQNDYSSIAYWLEQSYQNIEQPGKAFEVLTHVRDRNLQYESGIESYNTMAWIYHRNRVYTPKTGEQYRFLKNSVQENDSMAHLYLDSALLKIQNDIPINVGIYDASYLNRLTLYTYHYKAILFDYELQMDSANFYYDILLRTGYYSSNNYAEFQFAQGDFRRADDFFQEAESREGGSSEKRTREYYYQRGQLNIYRARPAEADSLLRRVLDLQGATPGFGWHSIGLARALQYEGLTMESQARINKAANFHELHIGTTWGPEQYNLCVAAINYTNMERFRREFLFENDQWWFWFNPANWYKCLEYSFRIHQHKVLLMMMVANNPERAQVIYPLFTSENLINFDEVWSLIDGFGNDYFIRVYKRLLEQDQRPRLKKYFRYMLGRLSLANGEEADARRYFQQVLSDQDLNGEYENLLYARTCEGMAMASDNDDDREYWTQRMYRTFPQLVPFSELKMKFNLVDTGGAGSGELNATSIAAWVVGVLGLLVALVLYVLRRLHRLRIRYAYAGLVFLAAVLASVLLAVFGGGKNNSDPPTAVIFGMRNCAIDFSGRDTEPQVSLSFHEEHDAMEIAYVVRDPGAGVLQQGTLRVPQDQLDDAGKLLAYRLFGIKKQKVGGEPPPEPPKKDIQEQTKKQI